MLTQWRMIVIKFLRTKNNDELRNQITEAWENFAPEDKRDTFILLYQSNQWRFFSELFIAELRNSNPNLPWELLLDTFKSSTMKFPKDIRIALQNYLKKFKISIEERDNFEDIILQIITKEMFSFKQSIQTKKQDLLASAKIAKSERLFDQQMSYLNKLKALFPNDINIRENIYDREKETADKILKNAARVNKNYHKKNTDNLKEEQPIIKSIKTQALQLIRKDPKSSKDFAVMFRQFGFINDGIDFLESIESSNEKDWFLLDFLFSAKQFISLLNCCENLKIKYAHKPDALFSLSYIESLTYWELGEKHKAINLMQQIAQMKPNFKLASEILINWHEEVN